MFKIIKRFEQTFQQKRHIDDKVHKKRYPTSFVIGKSTLKPQLDTFWNV